MRPDFRWEESRALSYSRVTGTFRVVPTLLASRTKLRSLLQDLQPERLLSWGREEEGAAAARRRRRKEAGTTLIGELPVMMSASEGEGGHGKADVVREVS